MKKGTKVALSKKTIDFYVSHAGEIFSVGGLIQPRHYEELGFWINARLSKNPTIGKVLSDKNEHGNYLVSFGKFQGWYERADLKQVRK